MVGGLFLKESEPDDNHLGGLVMRMSLPLSVIFFESIRNIFYLEHLNSRGFLLEPPDMVWSEDSTADDEA